MNEQTLQRMRQLKLHGMAKAFQANLESGKTENYTADELLSLLLESEWDDRHNRKMDRIVKTARFRYKASIEQITYENNRLNKNQVLRLAECDFIKKKENIIITGSTGIGKSYLASAFGYQACSFSYKVYYQHATKLFARMKMAKVDSTYLKEIKFIERQDLLIIDDFGLTPLDAQSRTTLLEIIEDRHGKTSTIITSQVPVNKWHEIIGEETIADAILDRIVHDSHRLELKGESLRKKMKIEVEKNKN